MKKLSIIWFSKGKGIPVAEIGEARNETALEWNKSFLESEIELSPIKFKKRPGVVVLAREPFGGLPGFLADALPDGWGRILLRSRLVSEGYGVDDVSPLDYLAALPSPMGALFFEPKYDPKDGWHNGAVSLDALQSGVSSIIEGTPSTAIAEFLAGGVSPNGARPKVILKEIAGNFVVGDWRTRAPEWIVKFQAPTDSPDIGRVEYLYSTVAREAGLRVAETRLIETKKGGYFATKRFDRDGDGHPIHMHSLSGLLEVSPLNFTVGYDHLARVSQVLQGSRESLEEIFRLAVFNCLAKNQDDHTKNVAFLMDASGKWNFAPAYDLTFHQERTNEHKMGIGASGKLDLELLKSFARMLGITARRSGAILDQVRGAVRGIPKAAAQLGVSKGEVARIAQGIGVKVPTPKKPRR